MAKLLFIFLFLFFSFSFILDLLHRREYGKVLYHMISHDGSHDRHGKVVHRPCSSYISSIENLTETLLSSLCQSLNKEQLA